MDESRPIKFFDRMIPVEIEQEAKEKYLRLLLQEIGSVVVADLSQEDAEQFDDELLKLLLEQMRNSLQQEHAFTAQSEQKRAYAKHVLDFLIGLLSKPAAVILDQKELLSKLRQGGILALRDKLYGASFWADIAVQRTMILEREKFEKATGVTELTTEIRERLNFIGFPVITNGVMIDEITVAKLLDKAKHQNYKEIWVPILNRLFKLHILTGFNHLSEEEDRYFNKVLFVALQKKFVHRNGKISLQELLQDLFDVVTEDYNQIAQQLYIFFATSQGFRSLVNPL